MMSEAIISPEALQDMSHIYHFIALDNPEAANRIICSFEANIALLAKEPELGQMKPRLRHLRLWVITEFPNYLVFYREKNKQVEIVRIVHGARDLPSLFN